MMFFLSLLTFSSLVLADFSPTQIRFSDLIRENADDTHLRSELQASGLVSVSEIPAFDEVRRAALRDSQLCSRVSKAPKSSFFEDSTSITTFATKTHLGAAEPIEHGTRHPACDDFDRSSSRLRALVALVSDHFVRRLTSAFGVSEEALLTTDTNSTYHSVADVAKAGEQLEHFHVYGSSNKTSVSADPTIDFHTDQGFFIAFTPAVNVDSNGRVFPDASGKFFIQLADGSKELVNFGQGDSLVFMLGDGVNQFVNSKLRKSGVQLRAAPHALVVGPQEDGSTRVWYGRMFLPPSNAIHPDHGVSYGRLRKLTIDASVSEKLGSKEEVLALGCSRKLYARQLQEGSCKDNEMWCWMRCMPFSEEANPEVCEAQGLKFKCTSQYNQIWRDVDGHGDYNPMCTAATSWVTAAPTMAPAAASCNSFSGWAYDASYTGIYELQPNKLILMWKVVDDGEVEVKMAYDGKVGWMAFGHAGMGGSHPGMMNARVAMAIRNEDDTSSVGEYQIHNSLSAFRHWSTPLTPTTLSESSFETDGCHSAFTFRSKSLFGQAFNLGGSNHMVWAIHTDTFEKGYHGFFNRGQIDLDFRETSAAPHVAVHAAADNETTGHEADGHARDGPTHLPSDDHSTHANEAGDHSAHVATNCTDAHGNPCDPNRRRLLFGGVHHVAACTCK